MHTPSTSLPLQGKTALVTGVSRRRGIGFAVAAEFARLGASIFIHHYRPHDVDLPWGADDIGSVLEELSAMLTPGASIGDISADLRDPDAIPVVIDAASALTGRLDILDCNHAQSGDDGSILDMTAERLDGFWATNTRSTLLLTQAFARLHAGRRRGDAAPARGSSAPSRSPSRRGGSSG